MCCSSSSSAPSNQVSNSLLTDCCILTVGGVALLQYKGSLLTFEARMATPDTPTTAAKARAWPRPILPEGNGRLMVRFMRESLRTSYTCSQTKIDLLTHGAV